MLLDIVSQFSGQLFLRSGDNFLPPIQIGAGARASAILHNGAVRVVATDVTVTSDSTSITVNLPLTIRNCLVGQNRLLARAQDTSGAVDTASQTGDSGFIRFGSYTVTSQFAGATNNALTLSKLNPGATNTLLGSAGVAQRLSLMSPTCTTTGLCQRVQTHDTLSVTPTYIAVHEIRYIPAPAGNTEHSPKPDPVPAV